MRTINNIPALGLGTWKLTGEKCVEVVKKAIQLGYRHIDTANIYGNQAEIGKAIRGFDREDLYIVSKAWTSDLWYDAVLASCDRALRELQIDYLDLYLVHWPNPEVPIEQTLEAFKKLKKDGKIKNFGVSNFDVKELQEALEKSKIPIVNNQIEFHPYWYREKLLEFCKKNKVSVTAYSPLGRGEPLKERVIRNMTDKYKKTGAQICLRWALQKGAIVIPKASSEEHLKQNMDIFDWEISKEDEEKIDRLNRNQSVLFS